MKVSEIEKVVEQYIKDNLLVKQEAMMVASSDGTAKTLSSKQRADVKNALTKNQTVQIIKKGMDPAQASSDTATSSVPVASEAKKKEDDTQSAAEPPVMDTEPPVDDKTATTDEQPPSASNLEDIKGQIQGIANTLETMDDFKIGDKDDLKAKKLVNKVQAKLDDILLNLDDLMAMKKGIDEQKEVIDQKEGDKFVKHLEKMMKKRFKNPVDVKSVMDKYHATARKYKSHKPEKVVEAIVKHMLKEGFDSSKLNSINESTK